MKALLFVLILLLPGCMPKSTVVIRVPSGSPICIDELKPSVRIEIWRCDTTGGTLTNCEIGVTIENTTLIGNGEEYRKKK